MSTQKGNTKKTGPPKYQNRHGFKNVYHDTSKQTQKIVNTEVAGVCKRCKDVIDWKIKYKKYKPLSQAKTCATCRQKTVKKAYLVYCQSCSAVSGKCAKCGESTDIVQKPSKSPAEAASDDRDLQFELEQLPERKRRTFLRNQEKGLLSDTDAFASSKDESDNNEDSDSNEDSDNSEDLDNSEDSGCGETSIKSGGLSDRVEQRVMETNRDLDAGTCQSDSLDMHLKVDISETNNDMRKMNILEPGQC
ncbi:uncharacterized protein C9orf85 homolog [Dreissena polymorpha]|nr:uncharacterized protein C9orf85 homolog [Dreissena polymorpha]